MPTDFEAMKQQLLESNDEFRQLATQHHDLDERIHNLATRPYLSEPEQIEEVTLKKRKLQLKDQMESMLRHIAVGTEPRVALNALIRHRSRGRSHGETGLFFLTDENRQRRISLHRRRAGAGRRPRRRAPLRLGRRLRARWARSSPTSSAIRSAQVPAGAGTGRLAGGRHAW